MQDPHSLRPGAAEYAPYFERYVSLVGEGSISGKLAANPLERSFAGVAEEAAQTAPAPGKWSPKEVLGHVIDTERIMSCRALRIARGDQTPLPGFDQDPYVIEGRFARRSLADLLEEMQAVRAATVCLLRGLPAEAWLRAGSVDGNTATVRALAWIIAGHELHHVHLLR
jgi:hypothetical protein